jgi:hypothetical protein
MLPIELKLFLCGFFGSTLVEVINLLHYYQSAQTEIKLPMRYQKKVFWFIRVLLACGGGVLAILYEPASLLLATHIGISTPLLVTTLAKKTPED